MNLSFNYEGQIQSFSALQVGEYFVLELRPVPALFAKRNDTFATLPTSSDTQISNAVAILPGAGEPRLFQPDTKVLKVNLEVKVILT